MKQQIISLLERAKENGTTIGDVLAEVRGMRPACLTCDDHGAVGNILDTVQCPDCASRPATPAADERAPVGDERCKRCGGPGWYTSHTTGYPESIPCSACNPQGVSVERLAKDPFLVAQLWRKPEDFADAYEGAREDLAIWKRRALEAERDLRAERETSSRLVAALNAESGPTHMGERAALASAPVAGEAKPVGRVRHFNYAGIARNGFSQEAVLNDDAPSLSDGALLYTAPQASPAADGLDAKDAARKTAGNIQEPLNGDGWHVVWWNESMRLMLPDGSRLDRFQSYRNGTMQLTIKTDAAIAAKTTGEEQ